MQNGEPDSARGPWVGVDGGADTLPVRIAELIRTLISVLLGSFERGLFALRLHGFRLICSILNTAFSFLSGLPISSGVVRRVAALASSNKRSWLLSQVRDGAHAEERTPVLIPVMELAILQLEQAHQNR